MTIHIQYDYGTLCRKVIQDQLDRLDITYNIKGLGEITFERPPSSAKQKQLQEALLSYGIEIIDDTQNILVESIKNAITALVNDPEKFKKYNVSTYLSEKLNYSYTHLSSIFSETTHSSIENFVILKKIDAAKQLIIKKNLTLTEIAYELNYSSVAHLSTQFKKTTGLTPSSFQRIIEKRKNNVSAP